MHLIGENKCEGTAVFRSSNYGVELISTTSAQTITRKSKSFESVSNSDKVDDGNVLVSISNSISYVYLDFQFYLLSLFHLTLF